MFNKIQKHKEKNDPLIKAQKEFEKISKQVYPSDELRDKIHDLRAEYNKITNELKDSFNKRIYDLTIVGINKEIDLLKTELKK